MRVVSAARCAPPLPPHDLTAAAQRFGPRGPRAGPPAAGTRDGAMGSPPRHARF
jgi:hypothetical protein